MSRGFEISSLQAQASGASCTVVIPADLDFFAGHFEGHPVLAGVAQLDALVLDVAHTVYEDLGPLATCTRIKFHRPIGPGDELELVIRRDLPDKNAIAFEISRGDETCSSGRLSFAEQS